MRRHGGRVEMVAVATGESAVGKGGGRHCRDGVTPATVAEVAVGTLVMLVTLALVALVALVTLVVRRNM
jgi:hypothetical protein